MKKRGMDSTNFKLVLAVLVSVSVFALFLVGNYNQDRSASTGGVVSESYYGNAIYQFYPFTNFKATECSDPDKKIDYFQKNYVDVSGYYTTSAGAYSRTGFQRVWDTCSAGNMIEKICVGNKPAYLNYKCLKGCLFGKCNAI